MARKLVWYEVIDLTSYGIKYPKDWRQRCGRNPQCWENSVFETLGEYSSLTKAANRLKKWANEKGIKYKPKNIPKGVGVHYLNDFSITVEPCVEIGLWYDVRDNLTDNLYERDYGTGAMIARKTIELDKD